MSFRLFLCKLGFHKWFHYIRPVTLRDINTFRNVQICWKSEDVKRVKE